MGGSVSASFPPTLHSNATTSYFGPLFFDQSAFFVCREASPGGNVAIQHKVTDYSSDYYTVFIKFLLNSVSFAG